VRVLFIALAVVIVGFVGWWVMTWKSVEPTPPPPRRGDQPPARVAQQPRESGAAEPGAAVTEPGEAEAGTAVVEDAEATTPVADEQPAQSVDVPPAEETTDTAVESSREAEQLLEQPVERATEDAGTADPFESGLRRSGDGWALHLISSTDRPEAEAARARYERQGYSAVIREATVKGQLWYRVAVGDFPSRAAAGAFREQAQEKFRVDWVGVVKK
jgi:septal ring-binding cell division protein DamX